MPDAPDLEIEASVDLSEICASYEPIPRVNAADLTTEDFIQNYFKLAKPVIITGETDQWPAREWTLENLRERVGENQVWIRGKTDRDSYRNGQAYSIRKDTFGSYVDDLLAANARARSSYLAVASMSAAFPQLVDEVPRPKYMTEVSTKHHLGPYMWCALKGHYEFCHFDPDDNFLIMVQGRKRVRLFGHDLESLYPNPLGSHGKTVQSQVISTRPDLEKFPNFRNSRCEHCVLEPGEMLFIPAFYWHQVTALDSGISLNMFYGDGGDNVYLEKILRQPYRPHFEYWLLNVIEQNKDCDSFKRMLPRLDEALAHFFVKQWHEKANPEQLQECLKLVMDYCQLKELPEKVKDSKFPPVLKIRGLLHREPKNKD